MGHIIWNANVAILLLIEKCCIPTNRNTRMVLRCRECWRLCRHIVLTASLQRLIATELASTVNSALSFIGGCHPMIGPEALPRLCQPLAACRRVCEWTESPSPELTACQHSAYAHTCQPCRWRLVAQQRVSRHHWRLAWPDSLPPQRSLTIMLASIVSHRRRYIRGEHRTQHRSPPFSIPPTLELMAIP